MLDRLVAGEVAGLPDEALAADLVGLRVAVSRLESEFARRLVVFDRRGAAGVTGAVSFAAWLRGACRLSAGEASERVRTARVLADDLPVTADALAAGDLSYAYAHARVLAAAAPELPADPLGALEPVLVEAGRHADPARLRAVLADLRAQCDPAGGRGGRGDGARQAPAGPHPAVRMMTAPRPSVGPTPWWSWPGGRWTGRVCPAWAGSAPISRSG